MTEKIITLAIETAVADGSLALLENKRIIGCSRVNDEVSKAADVLEKIAVLLNKHRPKKIDLISVSTGPGSLTGIRIGMATALGLKTVWKSDLIKVSVFEAIMFGRKTIEPTLAVIRVGGRQIFWREFNVRAETFGQRKESESCGNRADFRHFLNGGHFTKIITDIDFKEVLTTEEKLFEERQIETYDARLAVGIGLAGRYRLTHSPFGNTKR